MPHKQANIKLRVTICLIVIDLMLLLVVWSNLKVLTAEASVTIINPNQVSTTVQKPIEEQQVEAPVVAKEAAVSHEVKSSASVDIVDLIKSSFDLAPRTALAVSYTESRHNPSKSSDTDKMRDGRPFSAGLFQLNLTWHQVGGLDCPKAFEGKDYQARVVDETLYAACINAAQDPVLNVETAKQIYVRSGNSFGRWTTFTSGDYTKYLYKF